MSKKRYLSIDMGAPNTAISVFDFKKGKRPVFLLSRMMIAPLSNLTMSRVTKKSKSGSTFDEQLPIALKEVKAIYKEYNPDYVIIERYQSRLNARTGLNSELINMMIMMWIMIGLTFRVVPLLYTAVIWKNHVTRTCNNDKNRLKIFYKELKAFGLLPHQLDSALLGLYATDDRSCFEFLNDDKLRFKFYKQIKKASLL